MFPMVRGPPIAETSYPGMAKIRAQEGPITYEDRDFSWAEDALMGWRAAGLFGALVLGEGLLFWLGLADYGANPGSPVLAAAVFLGMGSAGVAFFAYTEAALAMICAAILGAVLALFYPFTTNPGASTLFTDPGAAPSDVILVLALLVVGAILLGVAVFRSVKISRALDAED
jgi:hypothetical protein